MRTLFCRRCGYVKTEKRRCIWCSSDMDTLNSLPAEAMKATQDRFKKLKPQEKVNYIIAMGIEGFTPQEIELLTERTPEQIEALLVHAGIVGE